MLVKEFLNRDGRIGKLLTIEEINNLKHGQVVFCIRAVPNTHKTLGDRIIRSNGLRVVIRDGYGVPESTSKLTAMGLTTGGSISNFFINYDFTGEKENDCLYSYDPLAQKNALEEAV